MPWIRAPHYRLLARSLRWDMEEYQVLSGNNVRHTVTIIGHGPKAASSADAVRMLLQVHLGRLAVRSLTSREAPGFAEHLVEEGWIHLQVLGDHIQAEQMPVDATTAHGILVAQLVTIAGSLHHLHTLIVLYSMDIWISLWSNYIKL